MKQVKHNEWLREQLKDPGFSAEYLTAAAEDEEPAVFLQALRKVAEAQGMAVVATLKLDTGFIVADGTSQICQIAVGCEITDGHYSLLGIT